MIKITKNINDNGEICFSAEDNLKILASCTIKLEQEEIIFTDIRFIKNKEIFLDGTIRAAMNFALINNRDFADFSKLSDDKLKTINALNIASHEQSKVDIEFFFDSNGCKSK
ncbi:MAG: hypothetical protein GX346_00590 [Clostridiales bacterium]|nr:hypothetical protein [Clostridiales bacterium]